MNQTDIHFRFMLYTSAWKSDLPRLRRLAEECKISCTIPIEAIEHVSADVFSAAGLFNYRAMVSMRSKQSSIKIVTRDPAGVVINTPGCHICCENLNGDLLNKARDLCSVVCPGKWDTFSMCHDPNTCTYRAGGLIVDHVSASVEIEDVAAMALRCGAVHIIGNFFFPEEFTALWDYQLAVDCYCKAVVYDECVWTYSDTGERHSDIPVYQAESLMTLATMRAFITDRKYGVMVSKARQGFKQYIADIGLPVNVEKSLRPDPRLFTTIRMPDLMYIDETIEILVPTNMVRTIKDWSVSSRLFEGNEPLWYCIMLLMNKLQQLVYSEIPGFLRPTFKTRMTSLYQPAVGLFMWLFREKLERARSGSVPWVDRRTLVLHFDRVFQSLMPIDTNTKRMAAIVAGVCFTIPASEICFTTDLPYVLQVKDALDFSHLWSLIQSQFCVHTSGSAIADTVCETTPLTDSFTDDLSTSAIREVSCTSEVPVVCESPSRPVERDVTSLGEINSQPNVVACSNKPSDFLNDSIEFVCVDASVKFTFADKAVHRELDITQCFDLTIDDHTELLPPYSRLSTGVAQSVDSNRMYNHVLNMPVSQARTG